MARGLDYAKNRIPIDTLEQNIEVTIKCKIKHPIYTKNNVSVNVVEVLSNDQSLIFPHNEIRIQGELLTPRKGDVYWIKGTLILDHIREHYIEYKDNIEMVYPRSRDEIIKFLKNNIEGLGIKTATKIVDILGLDTLQVISQTPETLLTLSDLKISNKLFENICKVVKRGDIVNEMITILSIVNVNEKIAFDLFEQYGMNSLHLLKNNPYILAEINPNLWEAADGLYKEELTNSLTEDDEHWYSKTNFSPRYRTAIKYYLQRELEHTGSLTAELDSLIDSFRSGSFLNKYGKFPNHKNNEVESSILEKLLDDLVKEKEIMIVKSKDKKEYIYLMKSYLAEKGVVTKVKKFIKETKQVVSSKDINKYIEKYETLTGMKLATNQKLAADLLVNNKISILTGGPGTGKTQTLKLIKGLIDELFKLRVIDRNDIVFLAPTGRAARRMAEVLQVDTSTIHRKLKLKGFGKEENPQKIVEKYIIVDEFSMVDVHLASQLLNSLSKDSHLLIVGDENQLPSIGAGLILRDLIKSNKVKTIQLNEVFRQAKGSIIIENSIKMKKGIGFIRDEQLNKQGLKFETEFTEKLEDTYFIEEDKSYMVKQKVLSIYKKLINQYNYQPKDILILSAKNVGTVGTLKINDMIQKEINESSRMYIRHQDGVIFKLNDPVIQLVNDYERNVFNGEIGYIKDIYSEEENGDVVMNILVEYDTQEILYTNNNIMDIQLAYCITVHKSQGSQAKVIIQIVDSSLLNMLSGSLIYTGYTRSEEVNIMIGQYHTLNAGLINNDNLKRLSLIGEKL